MNNWFWIALIAPFLWAISNHIDKFIISKYFKAGGIGSIMILTGLFDLAVLPFLLFFNTEVFKVPLIHILSLVLIGAMTVFQLFIYYNALKKEEPSKLVPLFQMIPVMTYIISYIFLHEILTQRQILASGLIIFGAIILSIEIGKGSLKIKRDIFFMMFFASLIAAVTSIMFKVLALEESFWVAMFWNLFGSVLASLLFLLVPSYKAEFTRVIKSNSLLVISLNSFSEFITIFASVCMLYAMLLAPIALVWVVNGTQPFFVFMIGIVLAYFFPKVSDESLIKKDLIQKIGAIAVIFIGTYLLNL